MGRGRKSFSSEITDNWEKAFFSSIGYYITLINKGISKTFKSEPLSKHIKIVGGFAFKNAEYKKSGVPIIRISDFNNEKIILDSVVYYEQSHVLEKYELKESDIIIALTGGTIGKLGIVQEGLGRLYLNQRVGKFEVLNPEEFEKEYIYWIARGVEGIVKNLAWGAAIPNVSPKHIEQLIFPIPTKAIQKNIIRFLNDLKNNEIIENEYFDLEIEKELISIQNNQVKTLKVRDELSYQLTQLTNLNQAILQEAVQGKLVAQDPTDEPASELLKRIKAEKATLRQAQGKGKKEKSLPPIKPKEIPFEIPDSWAWCRLGEICNNITKGSSPNWQGVQYVDKNNGILFITSKNVDSFKIDLTKATYVEEKFNEIEPRSILKKGDILTNIVGASIGRTALFDMDIVANINQAVCILRIEHFDIEKQYLLYLMNSNLALKMMTDSSFAPGRANLSMGNIASFPIPLPPLSEQQYIVIEIEKQLAKTKQLKEHIIANQQATEQLLKALLHQAFEVEEMENV